MWHAITVEPVATPSRNVCSPRRCGRPPPRSWTTLRICPLDDDLTDDDGLPDVERITEAVKALVARKPHLARRRPTGDVGQGARPETPPTSLVELLRGTA
jgi:hypothetical protein